MNRKLFSILLAAALVLGISACGGDKPNSGSNIQGSMTESDGGTNAASPQTAEAPA